MKEGATATSARIADLMHQRYCRVDGVITVAQALAVLRESDAKVLIVERLDARDEYGIVTLADIGRRVLAEDRAADRVSLNEIMNKPVLSVRANMHVPHCARLLGRFGISSALVTDEQGEILGLVDFPALVLGGM